MFYGVFATPQAGMRALLDRREQLGSVALERVLRDLLGGERGAKCPM